MKRNTILSILSIFIISSCSNKYQSVNDFVDEQLQFASEHYKAMYDALPEDKLPRSINSETSELVTSDSGWWCSGFYPGRSKLLCLFSSRE
jgi:hypothetical protein